MKSEMVKASSKMEGFFKATKKTMDAGKKVLGDPLIPKVMKAMVKKEMNYTGN